MKTEVDQPAQVYETLPHMTTDDFLARMDSVLAHGYQWTPHSRWWVSHAFDCPFYLLAEEPCKACSNIAAFTNPGMAAYVGGDLIPYFVRIH